MKNIENWKPSKFIYVNGKLRASRDPNQVSVSSRLIVDVVAEFYDIYIRKYIKGKLIDLGCGKAPLFMAYKDFASDVTCVDWDNSFHENSFLDYEQDLNKPLDILDGTFDSIILSDVLEHIRKPELLMKEMQRILAKDGILLMSVPFYYWLHEKPYDYFRYTEFALEEIAKESGFKIIKLEAYGGAPEILADIISKTAVRIPFIGRMLANVIQNSTWVFIKTKAGGKISKRTSKNFPLGYVMIAQKV